MPKYVCIRKCYHRGILFNVGDPYTRRPGEKMPIHFKEIIEPEEPKKELLLEDLSKKELVKYAENLAINLEELELDKKSRKSELISAIRAKQRDAKLNLPDFVK